MNINVNLPHYYIDFPCSFATFKYSKVSQFSLE